ncbi:MAG: BadF/BadG/BcrA/BcrD ATPase family protein [Negativicutes bacterium]|nr:BadF/BadG/BcrA/BcrD ATPase family protein [Negativicutes bacterium]
MKWILGIDGGGTRTTAWAGDLTGGVLGRIEKGPANYHVTGLVQFQTLIAEIVEELGHICGLDQSGLELISLGLAGVDRPRDREQINTALDNLKLDCRLLVNNDAVIALAAGLGKAEGIVLIAGTGSIAYGVNAAGGAVRAGGWGHVASDEGSGYDIGRQALQRGIMAWEGRDKPTVLLAKIMEYIAVDDMDGLIQFIYHPDTDKAAIAALTEVVAAAARQGDAVASEILLAAADALSDLVKSVISRGFTGAGQVEVCTFGGVVNHIPLIRQRLAERLAGQAQMVQTDREPVWGALQLGYQSIKSQKA